jgi:hypothetical protein
MSDTIYLSRFFVEFGPFAKKDILDLEKRGLLHETDYLLADGSTAWVHKDAWLSGATTPAKPAAKKVPAKPAAKAPTAKAPAAKKAKSAA